MLVSAYKLNNYVSFKNGQFGESSAFAVQLRNIGDNALKELGTSVTYLKSSIDLNVSQNFVSAREIKEAVGEMAKGWNSALLKAYRNNNADKFPLFLASYIENRRNDIGIVDAVTKAASENQVNLY